MDEESLKARVLHLRQVEKLTQRQIAASLGIGRKRVRNILKGKEQEPKAIVKKSIIDQYASLIGQWYSQHPKLMAKQVYERLLSYGYDGSYETVVRFSRDYRAAKAEAYHCLTFLPGEEAQIDWFFFNDERLGQVAGFLYLLSYSRYAWGMFYPRTTFEFFLSGHLECFKYLGGLARRHRYDNLKSVVIKRHPQIEYNAQFLDFARYYGFGIHACNPYSGNEKGRVERLIRDARGFLYGQYFTDLADLNYKFHAWLENRNNTVHRSTLKTPKDLLSQEKLIKLPQNAYVPRRIINATVSKTALIEFETNKYSVPSSCVNKVVEIMALPEQIEVCLNGIIVARHNRCFKNKQLIQNPLHSQMLLEVTPVFKAQRIMELMVHMDNVFKIFIEAQEDECRRLQAAYELFKLLRTHSKAMLVSAVRELNGMSCFKIRALLSLLHLPLPMDTPSQLWPQNPQLLTLNYKERNLTEYDPHTGAFEAT